tara:strand:- start:853 stop:1290 length:438 start_codon:yes stop_codon:yes gene_type:complete
MKNVLSLFLKSGLIIFFGFGFQSPKLKIGDKAHGGIIAWIDVSGEHGLVCAEYDLEMRYKWKEAKTKCHQLKIGGKDDWYLPSKRELNMLYENLHKNGLGGFANNYYWSSSDYLNYLAWRQDFSNGYQLNYAKLDAFYVRVVRTF